jgi:hypothetical protein
MRGNLKPGRFVDLLGPSPTVHQATGMVSVQMDCNMLDAALRLRAESAATERSVEAVAADVVAKKLRLD